MATWYIRTTGSDSNAGTSPALAFLTLNKAIGASGAAASGDTIYMGGGVYRLTAAQAIALAPSAETKIIGDVTGEFTGDPGEVVITGFGTNDSTAPFSGNLFSFAAARNLYTWENITFVAPAGSIFPWAANNCHDWIFNDCTFFSRLAGNSSMFTLTSQAGVASNIIFNRCFINQVAAGAILVVVGTLHTADYDMNLQFNNCWLRAHNASMNTLLTTAGSGSGKPYGFKFESCYVDSANRLLDVATAAHSAAGGAAISTVYRTIFDCGGPVILAAGTAGQIVADYNRNLGGGTYTNVTEGGNSDATNAKSWRPDMGQLAKFGFYQRPFMTPYPGDPHLAFSSVAGPTTDLQKRPVPAGGASSNSQVGPQGRHDTAISPGTTVGADAGSGYIELVGVGDQDFEVPVDAVSTTISIKTKTSGYSGTNYPQMKVLNGGQAGVADATATATSASASAYETLSIGPFTPTSKGIITVRLINRSANGTGIAAFDSFQAA